MKFPNRSEIPDRHRRRQSLHDLPLPAAQGRPTIVEQLLQPIGHQDQPEIATIGPTNHQGCRLATSGMNPLIAGGMIIARHGRRLLVHIVHERDTGLEIGLQNGSTGVTGGAPVRHMEGIDGIAVQVLEAVRDMTATRTYLSLDVLPEKFQTCKSLFWRSSIGEITSSAIDKRYFANAGPQKLRIPRGDQLSESGTSCRCFDVRTPDPSRRCSQAPGLGGRSCRGQTFTAQSAV